MSEDYAQPLHRGSGGSMYTRKTHATREAPMRDQDDQPDAREGQAGRTGVAERPVVPLKPGNAGGGKGPQFIGPSSQRTLPWREVDSNHQYRAKSPASPRC